MYVRMQYPNQHEIIVPALNDLEPGRVLVRAPIENGAIQANTRVLGNLHKLAVDIAPTRDAVTVGRLDGEPLQIDMYYASRVLGQPKIPKQVLSSAVGSLALERRSPEALWTISTEHFSVEDDYGLNFCLNVLVDKVQEKQYLARQQAARQQNSRASRLHKSFFERLYSLGR